MVVEVGGEGANDISRGTPGEDEEIHVGTILTNANVRVNGRHERAREPFNFICCKRSTQGRDTLVERGGLLREEYGFWLSSGPFHFSKILSLPMSINMEHSSLVPNLNSFSVVSICD